MNAAGASDSLHVACPHCHGVNRVPAARLDQHPACGRCHRALFAGEPVALDEASFEAHVSRSDLPVVVDFWAPWCGPCRAMAPAFALAAAQLEPAVRVAKLDTEAVPQVASRFGIRGIPTLMLFRQGREIARQSGAMPLPLIVNWVRNAL